MSSPSAELQKLVRDTLKANASIIALVQDVYDNIPTNPFGTKTSYIWMGDTDGSPDDADCINGVEENITLHIYSRAVGKVECERIKDLVRRALHRAPLQMTDNALALIEVENHFVRKEADGVTSHGVVQVRALIEEPD